MGSRSPTGIFLISVLPASIDSPLRILVEAKGWPVVDSGRNSDQRAATTSAAARNHLPQGGDCSQYMGSNVRRCRGQLKGSVCVQPLFEEPDDDPLGVLAPFFESDFLAFFSEFAAEVLGVLEAADVFESVA